MMNISDDEEEEEDGDCCVVEASSLESEAKEPFFATFMRSSRFEAVGGRKSLEKCSSLPSQLSRYSDSRSITTASTIMEVAEAANATTTVVGQNHRSLTIFCLVCIRCFSKFTNKKY